jgi:hypothetical protein
VPATAMSADMQRATALRPGTPDCFRVEPDMGVRDHRRWTWLY